MFKGFILENLVNEANKIIPGIYPLFLLSLVLFEVLIKFFIYICFYIEKNQSKNKTYLKVEYLQKFDYYFDTSIFEFEL